MKPTADVAKFLRYAASAAAQAVDDQAVDFLAGTSSRAVVRDFLERWIGVVFHEMGRGAEIMEDRADDIGRSPVDADPAEPHLDDPISDELDAAISRADALLLEKSGL
jgi:hypothetical protein